MHVLLDLCVIASVFMLLVAISFLTCSVRWADRLLCSFMPNGVVAVFVLYAIVLIAAGIEFVTVGLDEPALGIFIAVMFVFVVPIISIVLTRKYRRNTRSQEENQP